MMHSVASMMPKIAVKSEYSLLPARAVDDDEVIASPRVRSRRAWTLLLTFPVACLISFWLGLALGRERPGGDDWSLPPSQRILFNYNLTFALAPSDKSNRAWDDLTPAGRGFVKGDQEDSVYGLTVFHQLHCLDMIRHGFYADQEGLHQSARHDGESDPAPHGRHCFDYLRQTIQCAADTNLEPVDFTLGGVKGWTEHVCRDFGAVQRMAEERRPADKEGVITR